MSETEKDISCIPKGCYCYDEKCACPYWDLLDDLPKQYNGYCAFLGKSDLDLARERDMINDRTGEVVKGIDLPFPTSLLWDQCKECGINMGWEDYEEPDMEDVGNHDNVLDFMNYCRREKDTGNYLDTTDYE